jgi:hypothetical protein
MVDEWNAVQSLPCGLLYYLQQSEMQYPCVDGHSNTCGWLHNSFWKYYRMYWLFSSFQVILCESMTHKLYQNYLLLKVQTHHLGVPISPTPLRNRWERDVYTKTSIFWQVLWWRTLGLLGSQDRWAWHPIQVWAALSSVKWQCGVSLCSGVFYS